MPTNRRPPTRPPKRRITPKAVELFRRLLALEEQDAVGCPEYWDLNSALADELRLRPWEQPMYDEKLFNALMAASDDARE
jgi:hypothetical protein